MVIRDTFGHVFGCFMTEEWHFCSTFYGTQEAFVFTFHKGEDLRISAATEEGTAIQYSDSQVIIIGGSYDSSDVDAGSSIRIPLSFDKGSCHVSDTFDNEILCGL